MTDEERFAGEDRAKQERRRRDRPDVFKGDGVLGIHRDRRARGHLRSGADAGQPGVPGPESAVGLLEELVA